MYHDTHRGAARVTWLLTIAALLAMATLPASAQQPPAGLQNYDVELVIFRQLSDKASPEEWGLEAAAAGQRLAIPDDEAAPVAAPADAAATTTFPALPAAKFRLSGIEESLRRSRNYQPLAHFGWTQPGFPRDAARFLSIQPLVPGSSGLLGQIALSRGRYLHLTLDLVYADDGGQRYVLRQARRMRSNERHYIDHPKFGVIAIITPST